MSESVSFDPIPQISTELTIPLAGVAAVVKLLAEGSTVPFIARYRKEMTGALDEVQIRAIEERRTYLLEFEDRRQTIVASIKEQGKLTPELERKLRDCATKAALEDLYLPFKPKRRTRATIARERGLEPLAQRILEQPAAGKPLDEAAAFVNLEKEVADAEAALAGARDIVAEAVAENAEVRTLVRDLFSSEGMVATEAVPDKTQEPTKYEQYYNYSEPVSTIPSHRYLAVRRGEREGILKAKITVAPERALPVIEGKMGLRGGSPFGAHLAQAIADSYDRLLAPSVETDVRVDLKLRSDRDAVEIFASNLRNLMLAPPLGERAVVGIDPGLRTGCKCVAVDATGKFLDHITIYPSKGAGKLEEARALLIAFLVKHRPLAIGIGNGTGGRDTEAFARQILVDQGLKELIVVAVNEAGASVYSASDLAREEFPDLDLTIRGAISIARRLQDPLAELVKIDPKAIGVGQYQHDVHQPLLARKLDEVVESCVNHVGVEINTASGPLLARVAGIGPALAKKIVKHRDEHGAFACRHDLLEVSGLGPRTFEQAAGFLRVRQGKHPLDASAVHPERYELVARIAKDLGVEVRELVGNAELAKRIDIQKYVGDGVGEPTLRDIVVELSKPGRDPRDSFEPPKFRDDVQTLEDLKVGQDFEGVITNVTAFGAFVDIGVHQDGLVHISQLSHRFIKDPHEVAKAGDRLKVRVLEVDLARKRISLTAKIDAPPAAAGRSAARPETAGKERDRQPPRHDGQRPQGGRPNLTKFSNNPFQSLLRR
jgi:protein Tex